MSNKGRSIAWIAIFILYLFPLLDLFGWILNIPVLKSINPAWTPMKPITAVSLFLSAILLTLIIRGIRGRKIRIICYMAAILICLAGMMTIADYLIHLLFNKDFHSSFPFLSWFLSHDVRMAIITAIVLFFSGVILILLIAGNQYCVNAAHILIWPVAILSYLVPVCYILGIEITTSFTQSAVALNTGITFCAFSLAVFMIHPHSWLMNTFTGIESGSIMAQRMIPWLFVIPIIIGWFRVKGEVAGVFPSSVGVALVAVTYTACFIFLLWLTARSVNRIDKIRRKDEEELKKSEEKIRLMNAELEQRVEDRTRELEMTIKEMEAFSYSISHDLRSPLRHLTGFVNLLVKNVGSELDDKSRHYLDVISGSAVFMGHLIDDILTFSKFGRTELITSSIDLNVLLNEAMELVHDEVGKRKIKWKIAPLPNINGDPSMLKIVLMSLLSNAIKFTRKNQYSVIEIGFIPESEEHIIYVKDNGVGFNMEFSDKLFSLFQRLHHIDDFEGTGVGLAIIKRIIQRHGGRTWAEGIVDKGATFYFSLPKENVLRS